jgi:hypothetical protein
VINDNLINISVSGLNPVITGDTISFNQSGFRIFEPDIKPRTKRDWTAWAWRHETTGLILINPETLYPPKHGVPLFRDGPSQSHLAAYDICLEVIDWWGNNSLRDNRRSLLATPRAKEQKPQ